MIWWGNILIFPISRYWFCCLLLYLFFIIYKSTHVCSNHTITNTPLYMFPLLCVKNSLAPIGPLLSTWPPKLQTFLLPNKNVGSRLMPLYTVFFGFPLLPTYKHYFQVILVLMCRQRLTMFTIATMSLIA